MMDGKIHYRPVMTCHHGNNNSFHPQDGGELGSSFSLFSACWRCGDWQSNNRKRQEQKIQIRIS